MRICKLNNSLKQLYPQLLFALLVPMLMTATYFFFGFYYSEYEGLNTALLSGSLTPGMAFRSVYFSGNLCISYFYSFFYQHYPGIQWISWFEYLWMFIATCLSMFVLQVNLPKSISAQAKVALMLTVYILVYADHNIHLIYTRVAYMVCGAALISLVVLFSDDGVAKRKWHFFVPLNLFFTIGTLIRNEAAVACFLLLIPFSLFYIRDIKKTVLLFLFPFLVVAGQSLFLTVDIKNAQADEFYKQVEPDIEEQFIARENLIPLGMMKTHRDSVRYGLAKEMTLSDPKVLTPAFLRSLILPENIIFTDLRQWKRVLGELKWITTQYWYLVLIALFLSVTLLKHHDFSNSKKSNFYLFAFLVSFWGLTVAQTYVDKVNERSWLPYIGIFILCHFLILTRNWRPRFSPKTYLYFSVLFILVLVHVYHLKMESNLLKNDFTFQKQQFEKIKTIASNKILLINSSCFNSLFLSSKPFQTFDFSPFKKVYITDSYIIPFLPYYKQYLETECSCNIYAYPSFWEYIIIHKNEVVVVSSPERMEAIRQYLLAIYRLQLPLKELPETMNNSLEWKGWEFANYHSD